MDEPDFKGDFLSASRVAIWGLGLMGGSLAMALRGKCASLVGIDADPDTLLMAKERAIVDAALSVEEVEAHSKEALLDIDLLILSVPVLAILSVLEALPRLGSRPMVVMDLGSTKGQIVEAMAHLPANFDPIGGHPMCGKEKSSLRNAEASIFHGAPFALVPLGRTTSRARALAEELALAVEACPLWISAEQHDRWVAATSHAPFLLANALAQATPIEVSPLVGPGFRSTTRLAGSSSKMMVDILATNAENICLAIESFKTQLALFEDLLKQEDFEALAARFDAGAEQYSRLTGGVGCG